MAECEDNNLAEVAARHCCERRVFSALRLHEFMQTNPYVRIRTAAKSLKLTVPTVTSSLNHLVRLGIVKEVSGKHRDRLFAYARYINMVSEGTNPLSTA